MSKKLMFILFTVILFSCGKKIDKQNEIYTSIPTLKWITEYIAGDEFLVKSMTKENDNVESFNPTSKDITHLNNANLFIKLDLFAFEKNIDGFTLKPVVEISNSDKEHNNSSIDPHVWTSTKNIKVFAEQIKEELTKLDPSKTDKYNTNYNNFIKLIEEFEKKSKELLKNKNKMFFVYHPAFSYFADEFNLEQLSIEKDGKEPSVKQIANIIEEIDKNNISTIFIQNQFPTNTAKVISSETNTKTITANPLSENILDTLNTIINNMEQK